MNLYNHKQIEEKWQQYWGKEGFYKAENFSKKPKYYILVEFPYPSGEGLHIGHVRSYSALDAVSRKKRMEGYNVLFPIGWDAFGLPTENYAIKKGIHPSQATEKNIINFKRQLKSLGLSFDWSREINTTDPKYYKWTQWIFLQLFRKGLAYQAEIPINWCASCKTGLAHEEVIDGKCERCGTQTEQRKIKQWLIKITEYADRLIEDLDKVNYLEKIKVQQINWIGKSLGTEINFKIESSQEMIKVFTTRADTIFGVTAVVLAPDHSLVKKIVKKDKEEDVKKYIDESQKKSEFERTKLEKEKTGVFTGSYCINPINNEKVPIWIGDYVVAAYGGGAVMVVPAHDYRDYEFAKKYNLDIREVVSGGDISENAFVDYGNLINSREFSGMSSKEAIEKITYWLEDNNFGKGAVHYKLRDWVFSRQHYWGEPIPIIHCEKCGVVPVSEEDLPVELPYIEKYQPTGTGESPLSKISKWVNVKCPKCGGKAQRETDTMPNWAGSNWYYMRYCDPDNSREIADEKKLKYWLPVDWYNGGMEHTTLHLLYSRFIYKFLFDIEIASNPEPYKRRTAHGIVLAEDNRKMSKSFGNVINPDDIVKEYGADALRLYEMFMGPFDQAIAWNQKGLKGVFRFLEKVWKLVLESKNEKSGQNILSEIHKLNKKIDSDLETMKFNTIVSSFMEFINFCLENKEEVGKDVIERILLLLAPFAPHITEELWHQLGYEDSIHNQSWPVYDKNMVREDKVVLIIQINGKIRDKVEVDKDVSEEEVKRLTLESESVKKWTAGKEIKKIIFVPKKLINIVI